MKLINLIIGCLFVAGICAANDINLYTLTVENDQGKAEYDFSVSAKRLEQEPKWKPGNQSVPLSMDKALQIARAWIDKQHWPEKFDEFKKITLENNDDHWYYTVDFELNGEHARPHPTDIIILLDGSIVEPVVKDPDN